MPRLNFVGCLATPALNDIPTRRYLSNDPAVAGSKVSTVRDSVGCALMATRIPGISIDEINPTLSRTVLTYHLPTTLQEVFVDSF